MNHKKNRPGINGTLRTMIAMHHKEDGIYRRNRPGINGTLKTMIAIYHRKPGTTEKIG